jgi:hypothetical protein
MIGFCRPKYSLEDVVEAEVEDAQREHSRAIAAARAVSHCRTETNAKLNRALEGTKKRTQEFENFEKLIKRESEAKRVRRDHQ